MAPSPTGVEIAAMVSSRDINQFHNKITKATKMGPKTEIGSADCTDYADFGLRAERRSRVF
jgi:hypothetical protein